MRQARLLCDTCRLKPAAGACYLLDSYDNMRPRNRYCRAFGVFNREQPTITITARVSHIPVGKRADVPDLWASKNLRVFEGSYSADVQQRGGVMIRVNPLK